MLNTPMPVKLTDEDFAIIVKRMNTSTQNEYAIGDAVDARNMRQRESAKADALEHAEWCAAAYDMARREGAWEDNGCQPVRYL